MSGLSQDDFRRIMATPLPVAGNAPRTLSGLPKKRAMTDDERKTKYKKLKKIAEQPAIPKPKQPVLDPTYQGKYRDRAAERRAGGNPDEVVVPAAPAMIDPEIAKLVSSENKHASIAKGLDLSFLSQLKAEKAKLQEQHKVLTKATIPAAKSEPEESPKPLYKSKVAQSIKSLLQHPPSRSSSDLFLPGRLSYSFDLNSTDIDALPHLIQRSKDDCPKVKYAPTLGRVPSALIEEIEDCVLAQQGNRHRAKEVIPISKSPPVAAQVNHANQEDSDEDIFADAGEYIPPGMRPEDGVTNNNVAKGEIFKDLSATLTAKANEEAEKEHVAAKALADSIARAKAMHERAEEREAMLQKQARLQKKLDGDDEYGECFPDYEEVEEDEEDGEKKKKKKDEPNEKQASKNKIKQKEQKFEKKLAKVEEIMKKAPKTPKPSKV
ncbi:transmembrane protein [Thraustotheca clavata]|uniref:Transmembrane protein n=1 Tax=Thraustotheca clavata TaxID=74557 RepID=A0A1V9YVN2_9STRA|nr:transmembrane protein [Thraustotheca clavata]